MYLEISKLKLASFNLFVSANVSIHQLHTILLSLHIFLVSLNMLVEDNLTILSLSICFIKNVFAQIVILLLVCFESDFWFWKNGTILYKNLLVSFTPFLVLDCLYGVFFVAVRIYLQREMNKDLKVYECYVHLFINLTKFSILINILYVTVGYLCRYRFKNGFGVVESIKMIEDVKNNK